MQKKSSVIFWAFQYLTLPIFSFPPFFLVLIDKNHFPPFDSENSKALFLTAFLNLLMFF